MGVTELPFITDFPNHDIDPATADTLELLVMNQDIVTNSHQLAEGSSFLYKTGHVALTATAKKVLESERAEAIWYGVTLYESVATLIRPMIDPSIHNSLDTNKATINAHLRLRERFDNELIDANDRFMQDMPQTARVVAAGAERQHPHTVSYALAGAALARQLERYAADPSLLLQ